MKRVLLSGYYGFNNAGDEAILAALVTELKRRVTDIEIVVLSHNPAETSKIHSVRAVDRSNLKEIVKQLKGADLLISGGGSLLQDVTGYKTIPYYLGVILLARLLKVPVFFCAQGVGPINSRFNRWLLKKVLNKVDLITVRDKRSRKLLAQLGVVKETRLTADPVFLLKPVDKDRVKEILIGEGIKTDCNYIGVSLRSWGDNSYLDKLASILEGVRKKLDVEILLISLKYPTDLEISHRLSQMLSFEVQIIEGNYLPQELMGIIGKVDLLLGIRLHSLIFAAVNSIPLGGISYDDKVDAFLEELELTSLGSIDELGDEGINVKIINLWEDRFRLKKKINKKTEKLAGLASSNLELALRLLGDFDEK